MYPCISKASPNRNSPPAILLRETWREGQKIRKRTLANLSHWPPGKIETLRRLLKEEPLVAAKDGFAIEPSFPQGHVEAILGTIRKLGVDGLLSSTPCRERDLVIAMIAEFPLERLVACYNPLLAEERRRKRRELIAATEKELEKIVREVGRRTRSPLGKDEIGKKVGKVIGRYRMGKHFILAIGEGTFSYARHEVKIGQEETLDGIYVIRTSEPTERLGAEDTVRSYKNLTQVERAFRSLKGIDLLIRPIWHHTEDHVRAHIFICMLAYYVEWHMRKALAPLLFGDEELDGNRKTRDPVKPAQPSVSAKKKKARRLTSEGLVVQSFDTLLEELGTRCRNRCRIQSDPQGPTFYQVTEMSPIQKRAFQLLDL